jgi:hypothetical protein
VISFPAIPVLLFRSLMFGFPLNILYFRGRSI